MFNLHEHAGGCLISKEEEKSIADAAAQTQRSISSHVEVMQSYMHEEVHVTTTPCQIFGDISLQRALCWRVRGGGTNPVTSPFTPVMRPSAAN